MSEIKTLTVKDITTTSTISNGSTGDIALYDIDSNDSTYIDTKKMLMRTSHTWQTLSGGDTLELKNGSGRVISVGQLVRMDGPGQVNVADALNPTIGVVALNAIGNGELGTIATSGLWKVACAEDEYKAGVFLKCDSSGDATKATSSTDKPFAQVAVEKTVGVGSDNNLVLAVIHKEAPDLTNILTSATSITTRQNKIEKTLRKGQWLQCATLPHATQTGSAKHVFVSGNGNTIVVNGDNESLSIYKLGSNGNYETPVEITGTGINENSAYLDNHIAVSYDGNRIYGVTGNGIKVYVYSDSDSTWNSTDLVTGVNNVHAISICSTSSYEKLAVATSSEVKIYEINVSTLTASQLPSITVTSSEPDHICLSDEFLFVGDKTSNKITIKKLDGSTFSSEISEFDGINFQKVGHVHSFACSKDGKVLVVADEEGDVSGGNSNQGRITTYVYNETTTTFVEKQVMYGFKSNDKLGFQVFMNHRNEIAVSSRSAQGDLGNYGHIRLYSMNADNIFEEISLPFDFHLSGSNQTFIAFSDNNFVVHTPQEDYGVTGVTRVYKPKLEYVDSSSGY